MFQSCRYPLKRYFIPQQKKIGLSHFCLRAAETNISLVSRVFLVRKWKTTMACFSCFHRDKLQWKSLFSKVIKAPVFGSLILVLKEMTVLSLHFACCNHIANIVKERVNLHFFSSESIFFTALRSTTRKEYYEIRD